MAGLSDIERAPVDVSILVVSFNTVALTIEALASVMRETVDVSYEIIVVDNNSNDGSAQEIAARFPDVRLLALEKNLGFAAANNLASTHARGRYLLLLNPDTVVIERAVDRLIGFAERTKGARIWGGRTLFEDGQLNPSSCWARMSVWSLFCRLSGLAVVFKSSELFNSEAFGGWKRDRERSVDIVSGCFLLIERELWKRLGGFAPIFFMYGEEADLCLRAREFGARPMITPQATIVHIGGASEQVRADKMIKLLAAKATLIERHFGVVARPIGLLLLAAWPLSRLVACALMARITKSDVWTERASSWANVWRARGKWASGFPIVDVAVEPVSGSDGQRGLGVGARGSVA